MESNPIKCKIVLLGDQSVGKTSIINRFIFDNFTGHEQVHFSLFSLLSELTSFLKPLMLTIRVLECSSGILLVKRDSIRLYLRILRIVTLLSLSMISPVPHLPYLDANSYHNLSKWIDNVRQVRGEEALILIVGNKKDLEEQRAVQTSVATDEFKKLGLTFMEVSAKTGANVKQFFKDLAFMTAGGKKSKEEPAPRQQQNPAPPQQTHQKGQTVNLSKPVHDEKDKKKKGCC